MKKMSLVLVALFTSLMFSTAFALQPSTQPVVVLPGQQFVNGQIIGQAFDQTAGQEFLVQVLLIDGENNISNSNESVYITTNDANDFEPPAMNATNGIATFRVCNVTAVSETFSITNKSKGRRYISADSAYLNKALLSAYQVQ